MSEKESTTRKIVTWLCHGREAVRFGITVSWNFRGTCCLYHEEAWVGWCCCGRVSNGTTLAKHTRRKDFFKNLPAFLIKCIPSYRYIQGALPRPKMCPHEECTHFPKSRNHFKILSAQKGYMKHVPYWGTTKMRPQRQNLVSRTTWCPGLVHPWPTSSTSFLSASCSPNLKTQTTFSTETSLYSPCTARCHIPKRQQSSRTNLQRSWF